MRFLNLQEFSSKGLMDQYGVRTQKWKLATTPEEALAAARELKKSMPPPKFLENLHPSTAVISIDLACLRQTPSARSSW